jgi:hypothetical protein
MGSQSKIQTNVRLTRERSAALDVAAAVEGKDKGEIMEEALRLREELLGADYQKLIAAAIAVRFSKDPGERLNAMQTLRNDKAGASSKGAASLPVARAKLDSDSHVPA